MTTLLDLLETHAVPSQEVAIGHGLRLSPEKLDEEQIKYLIQHLDVLFVPNPSLRLPVIGFLHALLRSSRRELLCPHLISSDLFTSILHSLLLDTSPALFTSSIGLFSAVFPYAPGEITPRVPTLLTVLARAACWRPRHTASTAVPRSTKGIGGLGEGGRRVPVALNTMNAAIGRDGPGLEMMIHHTIPSGQAHFLTRAEYAGRPDDGGNDSPSSSSSTSSSSSMELTSAAGIMNILADALRERTPPPRADLGWKVFKGTSTHAGPVSGKDDWRPSISTSSYPELDPGLGSSVLAGVHSPFGPNPSTTTTAQDPLHLPSRRIALSLLMDIHGLWPSNLVAFVRDQKGYLARNGVECVYEGMAGWEGVWEEGEVAVRMSPLLKSFAFNPQAVFADAPTELSPSAIAKYAKLDPATVAVTAHSLYRGDAPSGQHRQSGDLSMTAHRSAGTSTHGPGPMVRSALRGHGQDDENEARSGGNDPSPPVGSVSTISGHSPSNVSVASSPPNYRIARGVHAGRRAGGSPTSLGVSAGYTSAQPIAIGGARGNEAAEREEESLRAQVEELKNELAHNANLKDLYLAHVHRLHRDSTTFASDEAERQLLFVSFKDQKHRNGQLSAELAALKLESTRMQETLKKSSDSLRDKLSKMREDNRKAVAETSQARAQLEDANRSIENLQSELSKVKETNFRLENKLKEDAPHISHIEDYRQELRLFREGQQKWDADVRKLKAQDETISIMTGRWRQMEDMVIASNRRAQKSAEEATELRETVADRDEVIRRTKLLLPALGKVPTESHPSIVQPTQHRESDLLRRLLIEAKARIDQLYGEKLDLQSELEQLAYTSRAQEPIGTSVLL